MVKTTGRKDLDVGLRGQIAAIMAHDALDRLNAIGAETLVIAGDKDAVVRPSSSEIISSKVRNSRLVIIEGGSHAVSVEMAGIYNGVVLSFLSGPSRERLL